MSDSNVKKGFKNIFWSLAGQIITLTIGLFIPRLVIVSYGSDVNGLFASVGTVISYLSLLEAGVGTATCQALYKPFAWNDHARINRIISATHYYYYRIGLAYLGFVIAIAFIYPVTVKSNFSYWFIFLIVIFSGVPGALKFLFHQKYLNIMFVDGRHYVFGNFATILSVVLSFVKIAMLMCDCNILLVQFVFCSASLVQMAFIFWYVKRHYKWLSVKEDPDRAVLSQRNAALVHQICGLVTNSTDILLISVFCSLAAASIYSVYNMIFTIVYQAVYSVNGSVGFMLGQTYGKSREQYCRMIDLYENIYICFAGILLTTAFIMAKPFVALYTSGADINYTDNAFPLLFLIVKYLNSLRNSSINTITVSGDFSATQKYAITEAVINCIVSLFSVWQFGMIGVLIGTSVAFFYRLIVSVWYSNVKILNRDCRHIIKIAVLNSILVGGAAYFGCHVFTSASGYITLLLYGTLTGIVIAFFFWGINVVCFKEFFAYSIRTLQKILHKIHLFA